MCKHIVVYIYIYTYILISFTYETESDNKLPFLDILVTRGNTFSTNVYRKHTFSGLYTNFHSFLPENFKTGLVLTLLFRIYTVCSDWSKIHAEIIKLRTILLKNNYSTIFNRIFLAQKIAVPSVPRKVISFSIPFMGIDSLKLVVS